MDTEAKILIENALDIPNEELEAGVKENADGQDELTDEVEAVPEKKIKLEDDKDDDGEKTKKVKKNDEDVEYNTSMGNTEGSTEDPKGTERNGLPNKTQDSTKKNDDVMKENASMGNHEDSNEESKGTIDGLSQKSSNTQDSFESGNYSRRTREDVLKQEESITRRKEEEKHLEIAAHVKGLQDSRERMNAIKLKGENRLKMCNASTHQPKQVAFKSVNMINGEVQKYKVEHEKYMEEIAEENKIYQFHYTAVKEADPNGDYSAFSPSPAAVKQVSLQKAQTYKIKVEYI